MSLPSTVFILANGSREIYVGFSKDLEATMFLVEKEQYEPELRERGIRRLVYVEEVATVRDAIARVDEIQALNPDELDRLVEAANPGWLPLDSAAPHRPLLPRTRADRPATLYIVANMERSVRMNITDDLAATMVRIRLAWLGESNWTLRIDRLVFCQAFSTGDEAVKLLRRLRRMSRKRLYDFVSAVNPDWKDLEPHPFLAPATGGVYGPTAAPKHPEKHFDSVGDDRDASGGVTAQLRRPPKAPVGTRAGRHEESWPVSDD